MSEVYAKLAGMNLSSGVSRVDGWCRRSSFVDKLSPVSASSSVTDECFAGRRELL